MREPSLHIKWSDFKQVIGRVLGIEDDDQLEGLTSEVFHIGKPLSIHTRTVTVSNERMERKTKKLLESSRRDADLLAQLIYAARQKLKHRVRLIKPSSKDWPMVKEITAHALDFSNEFGFTRKSGFRKYLEVGISKMQKFALPKFLNMYEGICLTYQCMLEIQQDKDSEMTSEMYKLYSQRIIENTGIHDRLEELPDKYVWFVRAREEAKKMNISVKIYLNAQFAGLDFTKGIPHPTQLVGAKATERVIRYCYENEIKIKK